MSDTIAATAYTTLTPSQDIGANSISSVDQTVALGGTVSFSGAIENVAGAAGPIDWTATVTGNFAVGDTGGQEPNPGSQVASLSANLEPFEADEEESSATAVNGIYPIGIALDGGSIFSGDTITVATDFTFSSPLPAGTEFIFHSPGVGLSAAIFGTPATTFSVAASLGAASVPTAGWNVALEGGGVSEASTLGSSGTLSLAAVRFDENGALPAPDGYLTTTAPIDSLDVVTNVPSGLAAGLFVLVPGTPQSKDTITGADGATRTLDLGSPTLAALAAPVLAGITASAALFIDLPGPYLLAAGQTAAIDDVAATTGAVSLFGNGTANESVVAGSGQFNFTTYGGSGTLVAGAGDHVIDLGGGGPWWVAVGNGANAILTPSGADTISTGSGASLIDLGSGASSVQSGGADTINGGTGTTIVDAAGAAPDLVIDAKGSLDFYAGTGASTVVAGQVATFMKGGTGVGLLAFGNGATTYSGDGAADTVSGLSGSLTVQSGGGGGEYFGGSAGNNLFNVGYGNATVLAGGAGDRLFAEGTGSVLFAGASGAETLNGVESTGSDIFLGGSGADTLIGGGGVNALVAGTGADFLQAGAGSTLFLFAAGLTGGAADTITGFNPAQDYIRLLGYNGAETNPLQTATVANGATTLILSDGTQVTFAGVTQLGAASFI